MKNKNWKGISLLLLLTLVIINLLTRPVGAQAEGVEINKDNFPDGNFRNYILTKFKKKENDFLPQSEIENTTSLYPVNKKINNLEGIEYFTKLKVLECSDNNLTNLDVSKNTDLRRLDCENNNLTNLDVSKNSELTFLNCNSKKNNKKKLSSLDLSKNPKLESLSCNNNRLTSLDLSKNPKLRILNCTNNSLGSLDLSKNTELYVIYCGETNLKTLDLSKHTKLTKLYCNDNHLTTLDLSNNQLLIYLNCSKNRLTSLDLSVNKRIAEYGGKDQNYDIEVNESTLTYDLNSLPGNFDSSKASDWSGGKVSGTILKISDYKPLGVTYNYDVGNNRQLSVTLRPKYVEMMTISFDNNQGSGTMENVQVLKDESYTLPECTFTAPDGKEFKAWQVGEEEKQVGESITVNDDTVVKAIWKEKPVTVKSIEVNSTDHKTEYKVGEELDLNNLTIEVSMSDGSKKTVDVKEDMVSDFDTSQVATDKVITITYQGETTTFNINVKLLTYTVSFDANTGTGEMPSVTKTKGDLYELPECTFTPPEGKEFKAWEVGNEEKQVDDTLKVTENITVKAIWKEKIITYTLTASVEGGNGTVSPESAKVNEGQTIEVTFTPDENYEIDEVKINDEVISINENTLSLTMDGDKTLVVKYKEKELAPPVVEEYEIKIDTTENGSVTADKTKAKKDETVTLTIKPVEGYELDKIKVNGDEISGNTFTMPDKEVTVTVTFKKKPAPAIEQFTISFDANKGTGEMPALTKTKGEEFKLPECKFTPPEGKEFKAWQVGEEEKQVGESITVNDDTVVKAIWKEKPVTVKSIEVNSTDHKTEYKVGEELDLNNLTIEVSMSDGSKKTVDVKEDMVSDFDTSQVATDKVITITYQGETTTFNINVKPLTYTVSFDANEGNGEMPALTKTKGEELKLPECKFTPPEGKEFKAWQVSGEEKQVGESITVNDDTVVKAIWKEKPVTYTLIASVEGGKGTVSPESATVNKGETIKVTFIPDENYEIDEVKINDEVISINENTLSLTMDGDKTLVVKYKEKELAPPVVEEYEIKIDTTENGSVTADKTKAKKDETVTLTIKPVEGYELDKIKVDGEEIAGNTFTMPDKKVTVTVTFKKKPAPAIEQFTISFDANNGSGEMPALTKTKGEEFKLPECKFTAPEGKEFKAWQVSGEEKQVGDKIKVSGDMKIVALWKKIEITPPKPPIEPKPPAEPQVPTPLKPPILTEIYPEFLFSPRAKIKINKEPQVKSLDIDWKIEISIGSTKMDREINGASSKIKMDVAPYIKEGRTMLPVKFVAEALGFEVEWLGESRTVVLKDKTTIVEIPIDTNKIIVNGKIYESDEKADLKNSRTMLPLANIARALGLQDGKDIIWDSQSKRVIIYKSMVVK